MGTLLELSSALYPHERALLRLWARDSVGDYVGLRAERYNRRASKRLLRGDLEATLHERVCGDRHVG